MNNPLILCFLMFFIVFAGCQEYGVQVRVQNASNTQFDRISINNVSFGPLAAKETSSYMPFENIYEKEFIEVIVDGKPIKLIPEDFKADQYYDSGNYKFTVDLFQKKWLLVSFQEE